MFTIEIVEKKDTCFRTFKTYNQLIRFMGNRANCNKCYGFNNMKQKRDAIDSNKWR